VEEVEFEEDEKEIRDGFGVDLSPANREDLGGNLDLEKPQVFR